MNVIYRKHKSFFFENFPPKPYIGWDMKAIQNYCYNELINAGFNLKAPIKCVYDYKTGDIVFWQEISDIDFSYSIN